jgi:sarcosine oxidase / L-pipecolate oxidase
MTFVCDGHPSRFTDMWNTQVKQSKPDPKFPPSNTREGVFQRIHGVERAPPRLSDLRGKACWNMAYTNSEAAFIDAKESIQVYYDRCRTKASINFQCGSAVDRINFQSGRATGVTLENGTSLAADLVVVAAGAWSNRLVSLGERVHPIGHEVVWIKVTSEEEAQWKHMSITTNLSTGLNLFPPYRGEVKVLRRSPGYINTLSVPNPEDPSHRMHISHPRTIVGNPNDEIPADAEAAIRENLCEIMPPLADRVFDRTKICW